MAKPLIKTECPECDKIFYINESEPDAVRSKIVECPKCCEKVKLDTFQDFEEEEENSDRNILSFFTSLFNRNKEEDNKEKEDKTIPEEYKKYEEFFNSLDWSDPTFEEVYPSKKINSDDSYNKKEDVTEEDIENEKEEKDIEENKEQEEEDKDIIGQEKYPDFEDEVEVTKDEDAFSDEDINVVSDRSKESPYPDVFGSKSESEEVNASTFNLDEKETYIFAEKLEREETTEEEIEKIVNIFGEKAREDEYLKDLFARSIKITDIEEFYENESYDDHDVSVEGLVNLIKEYNDSVNKNFKNALELTMYCYKHKRSEYPLINNYFQQVKDNFIIIDRETKIAQSTYYNFNKEEKVILQKIHKDISSRYKDKEKFFVPIVLDFDI